MPSVCRQPKQARQPARNKTIAGERNKNNNNTGNKKGKKKVTEYKRRKATGHAPLEQDEDAQAQSSLGSLYSVEEVDDLVIRWPSNGHRMSSNTSTPGQRQQEVGRLGGARYWRQLDGGATITRPAASPAG
jgi:hypothetical protein